MAPTPGIKPSKNARPGEAPELAGAPVGRAAVACPTAGTCSAQKTAYEISACLVGSEMCIRVSLYGADLELTFDKENVSALQEDVESKAVWVAQLATNRIILVNEAREMLGMETRPDCDIWLEPSQLLPTDITALVPDAGGAALPDVTQPVDLTPPEPTQVLQMVGELRKKMTKR